MLVVVEWFTKYVIFIPTSAAYTTKKIVKLFLRHMVKLFGV